MEHRVVSKNALVYMVDTVVKNLFQEKYSEYNKCLGETFD